MDEGIHYFLQLLVSGVAVGSLYALVAIGFVLIIKATDILNFAHGEVIMVSAFVCYFLMTSLHMNFIIAFLITITFAFVFGLLVERVVLRPMIGEPMFAIVMITIGFSIFLRSASGIVFGHDNKVFPSPFSKETINFYGLVLSQVHIWVLVISSTLVIVFFLFFKFSKIGLSMRGVANDQFASMLVGISVKKVFSITWGLSFLTAAVAGIFLSNVMVLNIGLCFVALKAFPAIVLGGLDSIPGAIIGGVTIGVLEMLAGGYLEAKLPGIKELVPFIVLFLVLMIRPYGLFGKEEVERV